MQVSAHAREARKTSVARYPSTIHERKPPTSRVVSSARRRATGIEISTKAANPNPQAAARVGPNADATPGTETRSAEDKAASSPTVPGREPVPAAAKPNAWALPVHQTQKEASQPAAQWIPRNGDTRT